MRGCWLVQDSIQISFGNPFRSYSLAEILPQRFGPADLLQDADVPLLLQPQCHELHLEPRAAPGGVTEADNAPGADLRRRATQAALEAAKEVRCTHDANSRRVALVLILLAKWFRASPLCICCSSSFLAIARKLGSWVQTAVQPSSGIDLHHMFTCPPPRSGVVPRVTTPLH